MKEFLPTFIAIDGFLPCSAQGSISGGASKLCSGIQPLRLGGVCF